MQPDASDRVDTGPPQVRTVIVPGRVPQSPGWMEARRELDHIADDQGRDRAADRQPDSAADRDCLILQDQSLDGDKDHRAIGPETDRFCDHPDHIDLLRADRDDPGRRFGFHLRQRRARQAGQQDPEHQATEPGGASAHQGQPQQAAEDQHNEAGYGNGEVGDV